MRIKLIAAIVLCSIVAGIYTAGQSEGKVEVASNGSNELVVTLSETDRSALAEGDTLRKAHKYQEAIASYKDVLEMDNIDDEVRAEAEYNIGLSYTWLGQYDSAETVFQKMLKTYSDNGDAVGYAQYCLAWIEVQRGKYTEAIERLQKSLDTETITDRELLARSEFEAGAIYLLYMNDRESAQLIFAYVKEKFADTKIANHPYLLNVN